MPEDITYEPKPYNSRDPRFNQLENHEPPMIVIPGVQPVMNSIEAAALVKELEAAKQAGLLDKLPGFALKAIATIAKFWKFIPF